MHGLSHRVFLNQVSMYCMRGGAWLISSFIVPIRFQAGTIAIPLQVMLFNFDRSRPSTTLHFDVQLPSMRK